MARTHDGGLLTVQHRQAQIALRARALRDYIRIWPLWDGTYDGYARLVAATLPLIRAHHQISAALGTSYYQAFRTAEQVAGRPTPQIVPLDEAAATASLYVTGAVMTRKALTAGQSPQAAMQTALVRTTGAVARHVLSGGRDSLVASTRQDPRSRGYERVLSPGACDFCQSLAGEPISDDFQAHDHCTCAAEPSFA